MSNCIYWFGDSWCAGVPGGGTPFANLTSANLNMPYKNYGESGTSIIDMVDTFLKNEKDFTNNDVVIFCLTTSYRFTWINEYNKRITIGTHHSDAKIKTWHVEFANDYFASFLAHHSINTLYYMCLSKGLKPFFVNNFYKLTRSNMLTPDSAWLLPPEINLAQAALAINLITPELAKEDRKDFTSVDWNQQVKILEQYFIPNDDHPTQLGNKKIADCLTEILKYKL